MSSFEPLHRGGAPDPAFAPLAEPVPAAPPAWVPMRAAAAGAGEAAGVAEGGADAAAAAVESAAVADAYARGLEAGRRESAVAVAEQRAVLAAAIGELEALCATLRRRGSEAVLDLALDIARRIVKHELEVRPERWLELIRDGVHKAVDRARIRVRVGPGLHAFLVARSDELHAGLEEVKELEIVADAAVPPAGCVVETAMGDVELGIDSQIATIRAELEEIA